MTERVTILHTNRRRIAWQTAVEERERYPQADVKLSGEQGKWKVRRDLLPNEQEPACITRMES